jgi:alkylhydroperoxidase/carboxymuconolactone decarboxylase family protein YurZ
MPNHLVLATYESDLLQKYEELYKATTLSSYSLSLFHKRFVLLVVVSSTEVPLGAHHVEDFRRLGGSDRQVQAAAQISMFIKGAQLLDAIGPGWQRIVTGLTYEDFHARAAEDALARSGLPSPLIELAFVAGSACRRAWNRVSYHLVRACEAGATDVEIADALTTIILPAGSPQVVQSCAIWLSLIREGRIKSSSALVEMMEKFEGRF